MIFGSGLPSLLSSTSENMVRSCMDETIFGTTQTRREGEAMMAWFLRRWAPLSEGLFDVVDDAQMGIFLRPVIRGDSLGKDILSPPNSRLVHSIVDHNGSAPETSASVNCGGNRMEEGTGDDLFQGEMGENVELQDVQSTALPRGESVIPTNLALERCYPVFESMEGPRGSTPRQRIPLERRGGREKVFAHDRSRRSPRYLDRG